MTAELRPEIEDRDVGFAFLVRKLQGRDDDAAGSCERAACEIRVSYRRRYLKMGSALCEVAFCA